MICVCEREFVFDNKATTIYAIWMRFKSIALRSPYIIATTSYRPKYIGILFYIYNLSCTIVKLKCKIGNI